MSNLNGSGLSETSGRSIFSWRFKHERIYLKEIANILLLVILIFAFTVPITTYSNTIISEDMWTIIFSIFFPSPHHIFIAFFLLVAIYLFVAIGIGLYRGREKQKFICEIYKLAPDINYNREIPFGGNMNVTYAILRDVNQVKKWAIIDSLLMKWVLKRQIDISEVHKNIVIQLHPASPDMNTHEMTLYTMMQSAADPDGTLWAITFRLWCEKNHYELSRWFDKYFADGMEHLRHIGAYELVEFRVLFLKFEEMEITEIGREMVIRTLGFKRYLKSLTVIDEQSSPGVDIWHQYLIFAQLFGIAEHVVPNLFNSNMYLNDNSSSDSHYMMWLANSASRYADTMYSGYCCGYDTSGGGDSDSYSGGGDCDGGCD